MRLTIHRWLFPRAVERSLRFRPGASRSNFCLQLCNILYVIIGGKDTNVSSKGQANG